jgi:hypothetical protein
VKPEDAVMMQEEIDEATHRPKLDPETGQKIKRAVVVWGKKVPVDPKIKGKRGKAK